MKHEIGAYVKTNIGRVGRIKGHSERSDRKDHWHTVEFGPETADSLILGDNLKPANDEEIEKHTGHRT